VVLLLGICITALILLFRALFGLNDDNTTVNDDIRVNTVDSGDKITAPITEIQSTPAQPQPEVTPDAITTAEVYDFIADLSEYEKYMNPENRDEYLILINTVNRLDENYLPADLIDVVDTRKDGRDTQKLREYPAKALEALLIEARANGYNDVTVTSAYRSYAYQTQLFNQRVASYAGLSYDDAYAKAATIVAIPGTSEHQSGMCLDMHNISSGADVSFADTEAGQWLALNSYKFGYILRFPADKTEITGISFEPWHFRYVGRYHAERIYQSGLCLEEYFASLQ
jgi:D-alanyl-D-alanine carboxypeptidase